MQPDIVLLILDTQRADRLSCYGYRLETSPYLDELASDATLFRRAFSAAQWTIPSHASMFTGLYPMDHTMLHASSVLPATLTPLAERLSTGGYFTAAFCNNPLLGVLNNGLKHGFISFLNYGGLMTSRPNQIGVHPNLFDRYRKHFKRLLATTLNNIQDTFARSDILLEFSFSPLMVPLWQTILSFKGNTARALNDAAELLIERKGLPEGQPVFSFINLMETHMPYHPPRRYVERFASDVLNNKASQRYLRHFNSDVFGWLAPLVSAISDDNKTVLDGMYDAEVAAQDELVGAFLEKLRASGRLDRTFLIVSADHGEHLGEKQLMGHSFSLYNELVHIPLLIRDPSGDLPRSTMIETPVSTRRIFHTVLTVAGIAAESEQKLTLTQNADSDADHNVIFAEGVTPQNALTLLERRRMDLVHEYNLHEPRRAVLQGRLKLIQTGEAHLELYDIIDDPNENVNLCATMPDQLETMQNYLQTFVKHDGSVIPAPEYTSFEDEDEEVYRRLHDLGYLE